MPVPTEALARMESFYFYSNNLAWLQFKVATVFFEKIIGSCFREFTNRFISNRAENIALFNHFYSEIV